MGMGRILRSTAFVEILGSTAFVAFAAIAPALAQELPSGPISFANGRVVLGADVSFSTSTEKDRADDPSHSAWFNYTDYAHSTMRLARIGATADIRILERLSFLTEVRSENGDSLQAYALFLRARPFKQFPLDVQAGRIPPTFGAFSRRSYGDGNPLIGYPLAYQYLTSLRPDAIPTDGDELLRMRARGWRPSYRLGAQSVGTGLPLVTAFRYDTGVQARLGPENLSLALAVTNGTVSDPRTRDNNRGKQISGRGEWRPTPGFIIGGSAARGSYLADSVWAALSASARPAVSDRSTERALGVDVEYSRDHWLARGEAVWNQWGLPTVASPMTASSVFVEGSYKILPGLFAAARVDMLRFDRIITATQNRTWDAPMTRVETGIGYYVRRNLLAKTTYQYNRRDGGLVRRRGLVAFQLRYWL
jgi:hypothetical protein